MDASTSAETHEHPPKRARPASPKGPNTVRERLSFEHVTDWETLVSAASTLLKADPCLFAKAFRRALELMALPHLPKNEEDDRAPAHPSTDAAAPSVLHEADIPYEEDPSVMINGSEMGPVSASIKLKLVRSLLSLEARCPSYDYFAPAINTYLATIAKICALDHASI